MGIGVGGMIAINAASQAMGMGVQAGRAKKQHEREKELMSMQNQAQAGLNRQGHQLQMDMWNKTNYEAQMRKLKEAGLNPALMYGMSGGGGTTTGSQSGGSAASGSAHAPQNLPQMMDIASMAELKSRIKLNEDLGYKARMEGNAVGGKLPDEIDNIKADTLNKKTQAALNEIIGKSKEQEIKQSEQEIKNLKAKYNLTIAEENKVKDELLTAKVMRENIKMKTKQSKQEIQKSISDVKLSWKKLVLDKKAVEQTEKANNIREFEAEMKTKYPNLFNVVGKIINDATRLSERGEEAYDSVLWWLGLEREDREKVE